MAIKSRLYQKKRGPRGKGRDPLTALRMPPELREQVDAWAAARNCPRSEAIRLLLQIGLAKKR